MPTELSNPAPLPRAARMAGVVLMVASVLEVAAMLHHPSLHSHDVAAAINEIGRSATASRVVHGILTALMLVTLHCLVEFCLQHDLRRPLLRGGLIAYATGTLAMIGAALASGFILPALAAGLA